MTYKELAQLILDMTPEQQAQPAYFVGGSGYCEDSDIFEVACIHPTDRFYSLADPAYRAAFEAWKAKGFKGEGPKNPTFLVMEE